MLEKKRKLNVIVPDVACFSVYEKHNVTCRKTSCANWISHSETLNCSVLAAEDGPRTLEQIGEIYGLTRMRICQIEKTIREKITSHQTTLNIV
jgi:hypothetical protein